MQKTSKALTVYKNTILLILRDDIPTIPEPNKWGLPGGGVDPGESFDEAMEREFEEELGIVPKNIKLHMQANFNDERVAVYIIHLDENEVNELVLGNEGQKFQFFKVDELESIDLAYFTGNRLREHMYELKLLMRE